MQVGWVKIGHLRQIIRYNSKTVQNKEIVSSPSHLKGAWLRYVTRFKIFGAPLVNDKSPLKRSWFGSPLT